MSEPTNLQRAAWAEAALRAYSREKCESRLFYDPKETVLSDMLCDLMHLAHTLDCMFDNMLASARMHYDAEIAEEEGAS